MYAKTHYYSRQRGRGANAPPPESATVLNIHFSGIVISAAIIPLYYVVYYLDLFVMKHDRVAHVFPGNFLQQMYPSLSLFPDSIFGEK